MSQPEFNNNFCNCQGLSLVKGSYVKKSRTITIWENACNLTNPYTPPQKKHPYTHRRGSVSEFSKASRKRLQFFLSMIAFRVLQLPVFLTLTYHYGWKKEDQKYKNDLQLWLQWLRDQYPDIMYLWRLEYQKRLAPHFHLILFFPLSSVFSFDQNFRIRASQAWHRIADPESDAHGQYGFDLRIINNFKRCFYYVSKYVAKESHNFREPGLGRRWASSFDIPTDPICSVHVPEDFYFDLKRIVRKIVKHRMKKRSRFVKFLRCDRSVSFLISSSTILRVFNYILDVWLKEDHRIGERNSLIAALEFSLTH